MHSQHIFKLKFFLCFAGSLVLVGGDPGVGKSTLLLQVRVCYDELNESIVLTFMNRLHILLLIRGFLQGICTLYICCAHIATFCNLFPVMSTCPLH